MLSKLRRKVAGVVLALVFLSIFSGITPFAPQAASADDNVSQTEVPDRTVESTDTGTGGTEGKLAETDSENINVITASEETNGGVDDKAPDIHMTTVPNRIVYSSNVRFEGTVTEACYLDISVNGIPVWVDTEGTRLVLDENATFSQILELSEGENRISFTAEDFAGNRAQKDYAIQYKIIRVEDIEGISVGLGTDESNNCKLIFDDDYNIFKAVGTGKAGLTKKAEGGDQGYLVGVKLMGDYSFGGRMHFKWINGEHENYTTIGITIRQTTAHDSLHVTLSNQYGGKPVARKATRIYDKDGKLTASGSNPASLPPNEGCYFKMIKTGNKVVAVLSFDPIPEDLSEMAMTKTLEDGTVVTNSVIQEFDAIGLGFDADGNPLENYAGFFFNTNRKDLYITVTFEDIKIVMADGTVVFDSNAGKPVPPKNLSVKPYDAGAFITWDAISTATFYTVYQSESGEGGFTHVNDAEITVDTASNKVTARVEGLTNDKTYYFCVTASNESGESAKSEIVSVTPSAWYSMPPVITMTSAEPGNEVYSAALPLSGWVNKAGTLTIVHNGKFAEFNGETSLKLDKDGTFNYTLILSEGDNNILIKFADEYGMETVIDYKVTYINKVVNISFIDVDGNALQGLTPGMEVFVKANVENYASAAKGNVLVLGLYDENNNLVKFVFSEESLSMGEEDVLYASMKLPDDVTGYTLKAYLWDNYANMKPISDVVVLK